MAPDPSPRGGYAIETGQYRLPAAIDPEVLRTSAVELWARVYWPRDLSAPRPILFFLHGNHGTCGTGASPRSDSDCSYTRSGTCPTGFVVTPNHEGYAYLAEHMASYGYIVVSINANRGITCGDGTELDSGLNLARGRLVLRHMEAWYRWATRGGAPESIGQGERGFVGALDFANVGLLGHSRGGEGMRAAYNLYLDQQSVWPARIPGLNVRGIFEIGAVDGQTNRTLDADNTAWNQLLPMCDGDVYDLQGRLPFERMMKKAKEQEKTPKSLYMAWGTNHNFFNTEWQESDSRGCEGHAPVFGKGPQSIAQQRIALAAATSFFLGHVGIQNEPRFASHFDPFYLLPAWLNKITHIDRDFVPTYDDTVALRLEEFDQPTGKNTFGFDNEASGISIEHEKDVPNRGKVEWHQASRKNYLQLNWALPGKGRVELGVNALNFRVARQPRFSGVSAATDFHVFLVDDRGALSYGVLASRFNQLLGPANLVTVYNTVRIPLSEFKIAPDTPIRGVRFVFDVSNAGALFLANVRLSTDLEPLAEQTSRLSGPESRTDQPRTQLARSLAPQEKARQTIRLLSTQVIRQSRFLSSDGPAAEITVEAENSFPITDELPTLKIAGKTFRTSRFGQDGSTRQLIFTMPLDELQKLPDQAQVSVAIGIAHNWILPNRKADLWRSLKQ